MTELYSFLFCIALGIAARLLFIAISLLAKRTNLLPVTVILDCLTVCAVGGAFTAYIILIGATLAPYMFAALLAGYLFTYWLTKTEKHTTEKRSAKKKGRKRLQSKNRPSS